MEERYPKSFVIEACVETVDQAIRAEKNGADQIELCSRLDLEGLTPDVDLVKEVIDAVEIPVKVMIRPVAGAFEYTLEQIEIMKSEIGTRRNLGVWGVVFGATRDSHLDLDLINMLIKESAGVNVTIHKAIDSCDDPVSEVERLKNLNYPLSVLTSGGAPTAWKGVDTLREMIMVAGEQIRIIVAGQVTSRNLEDLHGKLGAQAYHGKKIVCG